MSKKKEKPITTLMSIMFGDVKEHPWDSTTGILQYKTNKNPKTNKQQQKTELKKNRKKKANQQKIAQINTARNNNKKPPSDYIYSLSKNIHFCKPNIEMKNYYK